MEEAEAYDKLKTKVLKYVLYKKRSKAEVKQKFIEYSGSMLDNIIQYLEENGYINDDEYIRKSVQEFQRLNNMSIAEIKYKLLAKGIEKDKINTYIDNNKEELLEYEINSAKNIIIKKHNVMEQEDIIAYLNKKGYCKENIEQAILLAE